MKSQANKLVLSYLWWVLEPLLFVALFYFVFDFLLKRGGDDFFVFLMVGKIIYLWFSKSVVSASNSLNQNKGIIGQRAIPKWVFPLVNIQENLYKMIISFVLILILLWVLGYPPYIGYWQLIPLVLCTYLLICGVGFICAVLVTFAQDFSNLISLAMTGVMFGSGIFWDINKLESETTRELIFTFNPMASILDGFRRVLIYNLPLSLGHIVTITVFSILVLIFSLYLFHRFNNKLTRTLFS
ncbi:O-antigen export system permease protein rfbD [Vibrio ishigakensis]|uniref:Transport permease protein n=2 Tax=Vibrio ishigakensis TaxID=1481914 RepID=A0A0B8NYF7_9VIBR|nr:O-antigen export system permease protein rfbD [Vibrio ishigakensis]